METKENQTESYWGGLWLNKNKKSDKSPDLTGELDFKGEKYSIAIWKQEDRSNNKPDYKMHISPKQELKSFTNKVIEFVKPKVEAQAELN